MNTACRDKEKSKPLVLLVQPQMGLSGEFSRHPPLSLLYVASALRYLPVQIEILDTRVCGEHWRRKLADYLQQQPLMVGFTVMAGYPVAHAREMSLLVRNNSKAVIVWGGALPTVDAAACLNSGCVDFAVAGSGISATEKLVQAILAGRLNDEKLLAEIPGLAYRAETKNIFNSRFQGFEPVPFSRLPYDLIPDYSVYGQIGSSEKIFPIYSAYGCPYRCAFCVSPALYRTFAPKWLPVDVVEVVDHIEYLQQRYGATTIYFYDDDSFVNLEHIRAVANGLKARGIKIRLSFRGARVDEIMRMDDDFLDLLSETGTEMLHIGVESGCQRVLDLFQKGILVENIIAVNRKLARHKKLIAAYNWIVGTPTETLAEIRMTTKLLLRLIRENPRCFIFQPNIYRVVPGSALGEMTRSMGFKSPETLDEWINSELEGSVSAPWLTPQILRHIRMLQVVAYFVDNKAALLLHTGSFKDTLIRIASMLYRPLAKFRLKSGFSGFLLEAELFFLAQRLLKWWR